MFQRNDFIGRPHWGLAVNVTQIAGKYPAFCCKEERVHTQIQENLYYDIRRIGTTIHYDSQT